VPGDLDRYPASQIAQAIPAAAQGPAGALAAGGLGVGMGMAVARQMTPSFGPVAAPASPVSAPPSLPAELWYIVLGGRRQGPFGYSQLRQAASEGGLTPETLVWTATMNHWTAAAQAPGLSGLFAPTPPPIPGS